MILRASSVLRVVGIGAPKMYTPQPQQSAHSNPPNPDTDESRSQLDEVIQTTLYYERLDEQHRAKLAKLERDRRERGGSAS